VPRPSPGKTICVAEAGFDRASPLSEHLERFRRLGVTRLGASAAAIRSAGWKSGVAALRRSEFSIAYPLAGPLFCLGDETRWKAERERAVEALEAAGDLGAGCVYGVTGPPHPLPWEHAGAAFAAAVEPVAERAAELDVDLLIEATNPVFVDLNLPHTLSDATDLARASGVGLCLDVHHVWTERDLRGKIAAAADVTRLVQVADHRPGDREPFRAPPGDGDIPLQEILGWILEDGYGGDFDLE
jgi:sugar phosphate isomerase/epimerase